jgi:hypothetical protein
MRAFARMPVGPLGGGEARLAMQPITGEAGVVFRGDFGVSRDVRHDNVGVFCGDDEPHCPTHACVGGWVDLPNVLAL